MVLIAKSKSKSQASKASLMSNTFGKYYLLPKNLLVVWKTIFSQCKYGKRPQTHLRPAKNCTGTREMLTVPTDANVARNFEDNTHLLPELACLLQCFQIFDQTPALTATPHLPDLANPSHRHTHPLWPQLTAATMVLNHPNSLPLAGLNAATLTLPTEVTGKRKVAGSRLPCRVNFGWGSKIHQRLASGGSRIENTKPSIAFWGWEKRGRGIVMGPSQSVPTCDGLWRTRHNSWHIITLWRTSPSQFWNCPSQIASNFCSPAMSSQFSIFRHNCCHNLWRTKFPSKISVRIWLFFVVWII